MRAFIALEIPDFIRTSVAKALLGADARYGIKPIPPQNMHITLEFLGETSEETIPVISDIIASINAGKFDASLGKISTFGAHSSVAFVGMATGESEAVAIRDLIHCKLSSLHGIKLEDREFLPHLSIARGRSRNLNSFAAGMSKTWSGSETFTISSLTLKRSILGSGNAKYETIFVKELP